MSNTALKVNENGMYNELIRVGMSESYAIDLANRFYHNELTTKDLEFLRKELGLEFKNLEDRLNSKIDNAEDRLNSKIDNLEDKLNAKIENTKLELKGFVKDEINTVKSDIKDLKGELKEVNRKITLGNRILAGIIIASIAIGNPLVTFIINKLSGK